MGDYELYHANRKHKYIKKIGNRYFYTQQEIEAYNNKIKNKNSTESWTPSVISIVDAGFTGQLAAEGAVNSAKQTIARRTARKAIDKTMFVGGETVRALQDSKTQPKLRKFKKIGMRSVKSLKKQVSKGREMLKSLYKPKSTVTIVDRIDSKTGKHF